MPKTITRCPICGERIGYAETREVNYRAIAVIVTDQGELARATPSDDSIVEDELQSIWFYCTGDCPDENLHIACAELIGN